MVSLPTSYLNVPGISFRETGIQKTTNIYLFPNLRPSTPAPRPQHGFQLVVGNGWDTQEGTDFQQRAFSGGDVGVAATMRNVTKGSTFTPLTKNIDWFKMTVNNQPDEIYVVTITPEGNVGTLTAKKKEVLTDVLAGTTPDADAGLVFTKNGATPSAIKDAMRNFFGSDPDAAFDLDETFTADDTLVFTAGATGADGNFQEYGSMIIPGDPNLEVLFGNNFEPYITGIGKGRSLGIVQNYNPNAAPTVLTVPGDNTLYDAGSGVVGLQDTGTFLMKQRDNPEFVAFLSNSDIAYGPGNTFLMAGKTGLARFGLIAVFPSSKVKGQVDYKVVYEASFTGGLNQNFGKGQDPVVNVQYTAEAQDAADATGFQAFFRQFPTE